MGYVKGRKYRWESNWFCQRVAKAKRKWTWWLDLYMWIEDREVFWEHEFSKLYK